ncbi:MAG: hypothetical protein KDD19_07395, partial [Phaeodactylibacter sp.]|nr:hypothetical protein [Phaeodactylibacter sp.]
YGRRRQGSTTNINLTGGVAPGWNIPPFQGFLAPDSHDFVQLVIHTVRLSHPAISKKSLPYW